MRTVVMWLGLAAGIRLCLMRDNLSLPNSLILADETRLIKARYDLATPAQDAHSFSDASDYRRSFKRWAGPLPTYFRSWLA
ncbi:helix-turn-helix transcriptional regulator [Shewanella oncorhynchi]|uniref:helix-turn-helix transcriptional regulator n=2 Tax=Shewanella oncorhynchi TaxID=2726434 RepID=UPI003D7BEA98